ncbi:HPt (histidine-containing phosphotransfer) domain-containing protein [Catalinimonas alkaloidigena]|uniref:HPt (Histidine-containing phosphotransfer) domain-containing protein n=1 Tax=Catalinimonas alkaloidigena TaxID=1075417 RepID=A0A1G9BEE1_9BACT|nr:Hpt domain-containing protein [Catalinimonas alkaloidigena]SDK37859.1 HPt (histidine-containing phosphotransfer) domain-containing protein [Catalinimonas alkaloidigena]
MKYDKAVDLTYLIEFSDDDHEFIRDMIETFLENTPEDLHRLRVALVQDDWPAVRDVAHKIKPSVTFLGLHALKEDIVVLERLAKQGKPAEMIRALSQKLMAVCQRATEELRVELLVYV